MDRRVESWEEIQPYIFLMVMYIIINLFVFYIFISDYYTLVVQGFASYKEAEILMITSGMLFHVLSLLLIFILALYICLYFVTKKMQIKDKLINYSIITLCIIFLFTIVIVIPITHYI